MSQSLKNKRSIITALKRRLRNNFNISVSEVDNHDVWKSATIAIAMVGNDRRYVEKKSSDIQNFIKKHFYELEITKIEDYF
ncbi:MAG: DUF503 domain-containing protein [Candidatus Cloacimonetes bacterium]|nr:DUF503 domain-containing protein [Candidatus Cloacimonadota bacterium]MBS3768370.1 DUF503 domain-containing protein [Candidatus Cloacimonadota bacterium]